MVNVPVECDHRNSRQNVGSYFMSVRELLPQNGGLIRANKLTPELFFRKCIRGKSNMVDIYQPGQNICEIRPLSRDRALILYLLITWVGLIQYPLDNTGYHTTGPYSTCIPVILR